MRAFALAALAIAMLGSCAGRPPAPGPRPPAYSAEQLIETTPGPFRNRVYVAADRERQDAALGGDTVTTIIRRDRGLAWLIYPARREYEEVALETAAPASVEARFAGLARQRLGTVELEGQRVVHYAWEAADGRVVAWSWVAADGITRRAEWRADPATGAPAAVIRLREVRVAPPDPALFELPAGYRRRR